MVKIGLVALFLMASACSPAAAGDGTDQRSEMTWIRVDAREWVATYRDPDLRVTCWLFTTQFGGGIDCLPDSEVETR